MATFSDLGTIAGNANFQARVSYAMVVAAVNVHAESVGTSGHPARVKFAQNVLNGNYNVLSACVAVLTNSTISAEAVLLTTPGYAIPDADIQFAVNSLWDFFSGN